VECLGFEFVYEVPGLFKNRHHRGLRSLQELNDASVEFRVTGEYTQERTQNIMSRPWTGSFDLSLPLIAHASRIIH